MRAARRFGMSRCQQGNKHGRDMPGPDGIQKQWSKRHGAAVKKGIKKAKAQKKVVKQATLALRKAPKREIVQRLFTPTHHPAENQEGQAAREVEAEGAATRAD